MLENSKHKCTNAVNNVQPIRNSSHTAKFFQYITDCRPEITKTVMGTTEGKSTYSVYPCNASIKHTKTIYFSARTVLWTSVFVNTHCWEVSRRVLCLLAVWRQRFEFVGFGLLPTDQFLMCNKSTRQRTLNNIVCPQQITTKHIINRPASVAQLAETQCEPTGTVCRRIRSSMPGWPVDFTFGFQGRMLWD